MRSSLHGDAYYLMRRLAVEIGLGLPSGLIGCNAMLLHEGHCFESTTRMFLHIFSVKLLVSPPEEASLQNS